MRLGLLLEIKSQIYNSKPTQLAIAIKFDVNNNRLGI